MKKRGGYGIVCQEVTRNSNIPAAAKGIYAYLSSLSGTTDECYPSVETIRREMALGKDAFYKYMNILVAAGVVVKVTRTSEDGRFCRVLYRLTHTVNMSVKTADGKPGKPTTVNRSTAERNTAGTEHNNNNTNINNTNINNINNNSIVCPEPENQAQDRSGVLLSLVDGSVYDVPLSKIAMWEKAYPAVDIRHQLGKMDAWLTCNPKRRKTRRGIDRFINTWLSREQDRGGSYRTGQQMPIEEPEEPREYRDDVERYSQYLGALPGPDDPFQ